MNIKRFTSWRSGILYLRILPVLVWIGAVIGVVVLFHNRTERFEVLGIAQGQVRQIAATCTGRLKVLPVELFDKVSRGDVVAVIDTVLDNENVEAELAVISAEIQRLTAELTFTQDTLFAEATERETDNMAAQRRFFIDVENTRLQILELKTQIETDRIMAEDLALEVKIVQELLDENAVAPYELQKVQTQYNALAKKIEENEHLLAQAKQDLKQAQYRRNEFAQRQPQRPLVDSALEVINRAIKVQEHRMEEMMARREALVLRSPIDGIISQIQRGPGESVLAGEPILIIAELEPKEIVAYADASQAGNVKDKMVVRLIKNSNPAQIASSQVVHLGPNVELMPQRLWQNPNIAQWGRPLLIKIPPGLKLLPGETVGIRGL